MYSMMFVLCMHISFYTLHIFSQFLQLNANTHIKTKTFGSMLNVNIVGSFIMIKTKKYYVTTNKELI